MWPPFALGLIEKALVGVTTPKESWFVEEVRQGMDSGRIAFLGDAGTVILNV